MEQKYQIGNEYGSIIWDIEAILRDSSEFSAKDFSVEKLANENSFNGDMEHAMASDTSKPLIIVQLNSFFDKLIDGNHRLQKCLKEGKKTVAAYYLTLDQHLKYIVDFEPDTYWNVVNHWGK